jgi:hypothetical protein
MSAAVIQLAGRPLSADEREILALFRRLTPRGKQQLLAILEIMQESWQPRHLH